MKRVWAKLLLFALLFPQKQIFAQEYLIPLKTVTWNSTGEHCVWACTDMLVNHYELKRAQGLPMKEVGSANHPKMCKFLDRHNIQYAETVNNNFSFITNHVKNKRICKISIRGGTTLHAVLVVGLIEKQGICTNIHIICPDNPYILQTWTKEEFDKKWWGTAVCVFPD